MTRSIPIHVPREMTVTSIYGNGPYSTMLATEPQPSSAQRREITPTKVAAGWYVVVWDESPRLETATDDDWAVAAPMLSRPR